MVEDLRSRNFSSRSLSPARKQRRQSWRSYSSRRQGCSSTPPNLQYHPKQHKYPHNHQHPCYIHIHHHHNLEYWVIFTAMCVFLMIIIRVVIFIFMIMLIMSCPWLKPDQKTPAQPQGTPHPSPPRIYCLPKTKAKERETVPDKTNILKVCCHGVLYSSETKNIVYIWDCPKSGPPARRKVIFLVLISLFQGGQFKFTHFFTILVISQGASILYNNNTDWTWVYM